MFDFDELENRILAFSPNSEYYAYTVVWFGDMKYSETKGYYIDALCFDESVGEIIEERFYMIRLDIEDVVEVNSKFYPKPEQELIDRLFNFIWA